MQSAEELKTSLESVTRSVCKTINLLTEALKEDDPLKRDKKCGRALKEVELVNDAAMINVLGLSFRQVAQLKTRSRARSEKPRVAEGRESTPHQRLMDFHAKHVVGPIPDGGAQGAAIKWILMNFTETLAIGRYEAQLKEEWRKGRVSWLTVKQEIGRVGQNGSSRDATERNADRLGDNFALIQELRGEDRGDYH